jgi:hypothetical protein
MRFAYFLAKYHSPSLKRELRQVETVAAFSDESHGSSKLPRFGAFTGAITQNLGRFAPRAYASLSAHGAPTSAGNQIGLALPHGLFLRL